MSTTLEVLFTPAEYALLGQRDLSETVTVVFDVLRATSTIVTALANDAATILPVAEIAEALSIRRRRPEVLLAGERDGVRIQSDLTGSIAFDLGNSPREFIKEKIAGRTIVLTTTNGTRALRACAAAKTVLVGSLLNLSALTDFIEREYPIHLLLVCSGTIDQAAYEDVLAAGALCDLVWPKYSSGMVADSARIAHRLFRLEQKDLVAAMTQSRNGRRLLAHPDLAGDVPFCAQRDLFRLCPKLGKDGVIRTQTNTAEALSQPHSRRAG